MGTQIQPTTLAARHSIVKRVHMMAAIHPIKRTIMDRLQTQLEADEAIARIVGQQVKNGVWQRVGPGTDG